MGNDEFFKKRRAAQQQRKAERRTPKPGSLLIVTEGEKTEPLYLKGMTDSIKERYGGQLQVCDIKGLGMGTVRLVEEALRIANRTPFMYESKWVCFDKDDFQDFDEAVRLATENGFRVAWSNQAFEYWLYLHFAFSDAALHRDEWFSKVDELVQKNHLGDGRYTKNMKNMFAVFAGDGRLKTAMRNATTIQKRYPNTAAPSQCDPCTTELYTS